MRYLSLIALIIIAAWTFALSQREPTIPVAVHSQLASELRQVIAQYIESNVQGVENLRFQKVFTEVIQPEKKLRAYVKYAYDITLADGMKTREAREGYFNLITEDRGQTWSAEVGEFSETNLEFLEDFRITPKSSAN